VLIIVFNADLKFPHSLSDIATPRMQTLINKIIPMLEQFIEDDDTIKTQLILTKMN